MTTMADQIERVNWLLQERQTDPTTVATVIAQHQEAISGLARRKTFPTLQWMQGIATQSQYTLPVSTATIDYIFYNETQLIFATELTLDRLRRQWENQFQGDPLFWTTDNQDPNTFRLIPAPSRTGSEVPVFPSPLNQSLTDNLVIFLTEDPSAAVTNPENALPTLLDYDDLLVYDSVAALAARETDVQNLPLAQLSVQVGQLWWSLLGGKTP